ncbi:hypothetical protein ABEB36_007075 [Hypothenemus hampei]|uniref:Elongator complex protein 2 n=1 Tax=Hypothenemus hampei TaxID=57062 RepID=A0ABD1ETM2_HYPHA
MDYKVAYISSNCNQTPTAADCNENNIIAYGAFNAILIYDPNWGSGGKVIDSLMGHTKRVNSVRWIRSCTDLVKNKSQELVSGSSDGSIKVWTFNGTSYSPLTVNHDDNLGVNLVDGYYTARELIICSAAIEDTTIRIWIRKENSAELCLMENIKFGTTVSSLCVGLRIWAAPENRLLIACALDDSTVRLLHQTSSENKWVTFATLTGHEDWVQGLDFTFDKGSGYTMLATSSQDNLIRIWRLHNETDVTLDAILAGHEGWVYSVHWHSEEMLLLSASIDKTLVIWHLDKSSGLWLEKVRLGEVGGNTLGFYGAFFNPLGHVVAYSYHGAFHIWSKNELDHWQPLPTVGGHSREVSDLAWEPKGMFVYSLGTDQTTRIHAPWQRDNRAVTWHEIGRPQIHGYDLNTLAVISRYKFASGADEKVIRIFEGPETFLQNIQSLGIIEKEEVSSFIPKGASVPSLGLSNKAVFSEDNLEDTLPIDKKNPYPEESHFKMEILTEPPTEENLLQNTLWPEIQKLYGHGYEIYSLAASSDGKYLASACKSTKPQHASIFIWNTANWQQVQQLASHNLTVVQMQFSPNACHLLSVSRDRRWSLFSRTSDNQFELKANCSKRSSIHTRIIWTCAWTHDSKYFATGSRDGKMVLWHQNSGKQPQDDLGCYENAMDPLEFPNQSVTALAFAPCNVSDGYLCAVGFESGTINLFIIDKQLAVCQMLHIPQSMAHHLTVRKLAFRPELGRAGHQCSKEVVLQLASAGADTLLRIFDILL